VTKQTLFCIFIICFILAGCVTIPDRHSTIGKYNELHDIDTECSFEKDMLSTNTLATLQQSDTLNSQGFSILNWNSYKGSKKGWQEDLDRLSNLSDLVVLQEGYLTDDLRNMLNSKKYNWDIAQAFTYYNISTGVLTASRVTPDFLCSFRVFEPLSGIPKTALITRYPLSGTDESLLLANIHMINFSLDIDAYRDQLEMMAKVLSKHGGPLIITGDFNSWSTKRMGILSNITQQLRLRTVTFESDDRTTFMGQVVDHVYYRQLIPLKAFSEKLTTSDHNPMMVTFRLANDI
jgi:endonuclease/exonuclease/phosphatase (EEP) superfamily protein YafD